MDVMNVPEYFKKIVVVITMLIGITIIAMSYYTNAQLKDSMKKVKLEIQVNDTTEQIAAKIKNYKDALEVKKEEAGYLNTLLVTDFLKALFNTLLTTVIAYVFGKPIVVAIAERIKGRRGD